MDGRVRKADWGGGGSSSVFEAELADVIPICHTTIAGTRIVGRLTAGYVLRKYHFPNTTKGRFDSEGSERRYMAN